MQLTSPCNCSASFVLEGLLLAKGEMPTFSSVLGAIEYHLRPEKCDWWGGPFNGQYFRQNIFIDLYRSCEFDYIVETGTFCGTTTLFFAQNTGVPIYTTECSSRFYGYSRRRLRRLSKVRQHLADTRTFLHSLSMPKDSRVFFYLDAHWEDDLPLAEETEFIVSSFSNFVIMIDDFAVAGDGGYKFDDYGPGKQLSLRDFPFHRDVRISCYFPSRPGCHESGSRKGSIVLASQSMGPFLDHLSCLRKVAEAATEAA